MLAINYYRFKFMFLSQKIFHFVAVRNHDKYFSLDED